MNVYMCIVCGFLYDEAAGRPDEGIPVGTPWTQVPETWSCPECAVSKAEFIMVAL